MQNAQYGKLKQIFFPPPQEQTSSPRSDRVVPCESVPGETEALAETPPGGPDHGQSGAGQRRVAAGVCVCVCGLSVEHQISTGIYLMCECVCGLTFTPAYEAMRTDGHER